MKRFLQLVSLMLPLAIATNSLAADAELPADFCEQSLFGEKVAANPELNKLVSEYFIESSHEDNMQIRLRHNEADQAAACAEQLKGWLVSLGFASEQLLLEADNARDGSFRFDLMD